MIRSARIFAALIGGLTLMWQGGEVLNGELLNRFLVADIILGLLMIVAAALPRRYDSVLAMLVAYAYSSGVYAVATTGGLLLGSYDFGAFTTTLGLVPCAIFVILLSRWLAMRLIKTI